MCYERCANDGKKDDARLKLCLHFYPRSGCSNSYAPLALVRPVNTMSTDRTLFPLPRRLFAFPRRSCISRNLSKSTSKLREFVGSRPRLLPQTSNVKRRPMVALRGSCAERRTRIRPKARAGVRCAFAEWPARCRRWWSDGATLGTPRLRARHHQRQHVALGLTHVARSRGSCRGTPSRRHRRSSFSGPERDAARA
jgi:hypothetical protein